MDPHCGSSNSVAEYLSVRLLGRVRPKIKNDHVQRADTRTDRGPYAHDFDNSIEGGYKPLLAAAARFWFSGFGHAMLFFSVPGTRLSTAPGGPPSNSPRHVHFTLF